MYAQREQAKYLTTLTADEFCHAVETIDGRLLYVFCAERTLYKIANGYEAVRVYVKHDYTPNEGGFDVVISLHGLEMPIVRLFGD